jgi:deoxyribose-phosphate aldolase
MQYSKFFDHTLLKADASLDQIVKLCKEAAFFSFYSVCVNPFYVPVCKRILRGTDVKVATVIGFPLGQTSPKMKVEEAVDAIKMGADEVDMVQNIAAAKAHDFKFIELEVQKVKQAIGKDRVLKVILETCYLNRREIVQCCLAAKRAGADFVKTSTGFGPGGATVRDVQLMRSTVGPDIGVKASGGIRTKADLLKMITAGANRIGSSNSASIMREFLK